jgi:hypothetical protein
LRKEGDLLALKVTVKLKALTRLPGDSIKVRNAILMQMVDKKKVLKIRWKFPKALQKQFSSNCQSEKKSISLGSNF